jgi:hypothetical protein
MAKRPKSDGVQLSLDLEIRDSEAKPSSAPKLAPRNHNVVGFVDDPRREAGCDQARPTIGDFSSTPRPEIKGMT